MSLNLATVTVPPPLCTWCMKPATHLTIAPLSDIWQDGPHVAKRDERQTWAEACPAHRRGVWKPRPRALWRPKFPQVGRS